MEEDTHAEFSYISHCEHCIKCGTSNKQCIMDYYENHFKSKILNINLKRLSIIWKYCDMQTSTFRISNSCNDHSNISSWNWHMKKHAGFKNLKL